MHFLRDMTQKRSEHFVFFARPAGERLQRSPELTRVCSPEVTRRL